jgi:hypothetical protein
MSKQVLARDYEPLGAVTDFSFAIFFHVSAKPLFPAVAFS